MYFPKSQITTNLYTNGGEYVYVSTNEEYTGYYFQTSEGRYFTGRNPNDPPNKEIQIQETSKLRDAEEGEIGSYNLSTSLYLVPEVYATAKSLNPNSSPPLPPTQVINLPTKENYKWGEFQRYFSSKNNEVRYTEIDENQYTKFIDKDPNVDYALYKVFQFPWLISGNRNEVINVNKKTIERTTLNLKLSGFKSYFKNRYDQYYKYTKGSNLKTDGTEFLNKSTGKRYIGLYHIHPEKGPMVGAEHTLQIHDYLIPISGSNMDSMVNKIETQNMNEPKMKTYNSSSNTFGGY